MTLTHGELFAGIGGFGEGFKRAGIVTKWCVEIDAACQRVLRRHNPDIPILGDIRDCGAHNLEPVDIISFGSPCQDLSVAGKREGLNGERSGLFFEAIRILGELKPTFGVWENVPGALSSHSGRDFAAVLAAFRDIGARDIAWTCLDAQYFGVAQRRRRVFLVADFRGERAAEILFESSRSAWDSPPSREAGQTTTALTGSGPGANGGADDNAAQGRQLVADPLTKSFAKYHGASGGKDSLPRNHIVVAQCHGTNVGPMGTLRQGDGHVTSGVPFVAFDRTQSSVSGDVAGPLRACGAQTEGVNDGKADTQCVAWHENQGGDLTPDPDGVAKALKAGASHNYQGVAYGVSENQRAEVLLTAYSCQITSGGGKPGQGYPCVAIQHSIIGRKLEAGAQGKGYRDDSSTWTLDNRGDPDAIAGPFGVRRLTPTECERLQGFPDDWTAGNSDTQRYRELGNAVATPCAEWLARRIVEVEAAT